MMASQDSGSIPLRLAEALRGRFEVVRELTGGGMSRVFRVRDVVLDRQIVIKILPPELAAEVNRDRFRLLADHLRRRDERLMRLLRDSIANALRSQIADSVARTAQAEILAARARESAQAARPGRIVIPDLSGLARPPRSEIASPEAFRARAATMGPARRISVAVYSGLRSPPIILAAAEIRDSLLVALKGSPRFLPIPPDTVNAALERNRSVDSLQVILRTDLFLTINATGSVGSDSLRWNISARDFSAHSSYATRSTVRENPLAQRGIGTASRTGAVRGTARREPASVYFSHCEFAT